MLVRKLTQGLNLNCFLNELIRICDVLCIYTGVAAPEGEAHRHEPPIPHDEVMVDTRKNNAELEEDKKQPVPPVGGGDEEPKRDGGHAVEIEVEKDHKVEEKPKPEEAVVRKEEVDLGGGEILSNEVLEKLDADAGKKQDVPRPKEVEKLDSVKDPLAGNAAEVVNQVHNVGKAPEAAGKREYSSSSSLFCVTLVT